MNKLSPYAKAIVGAIVAALNVLYQALDDSAVTGQEWIACAIALLTTGALVFSIPNKDDTGEHQEESVQPPDAGYASLPALILVAVCVVVVVFALRG